MVSMVVAMSGCTMPTFRDAVTEMSVPRIGEQSKMGGTHVGNVSPRPLAELGCLPEVLYQYLIFIDMHPHSS